MLNNIGKSDEILALILGKFSTKEPVELKLDGQMRRLHFQELLTKDYGARVRLSDEVGTVVIHINRGHRAAQAELTYKPLPKGDDNGPAWVLRSLGLFLFKNEVGYLVIN